MTPQEEDTEMDVGVAVTALHLLKVVIELRGHVDVPVLSQLSDWLEKVVVFALCGLHGNRSQQVLLPEVPRDHVNTQPTLLTFGQKVKLVQAEPSTNVKGDQPVTRKIIRVSPSISPTQRQTLLCYIK